MPGLLGRESAWSDTLYGRLQSANLIYLINHYYPRKRTSSRRYWHRCPRWRYARRHFWYPWRCGRAWRGGHSWRGGRDINGATRVSRKTRVATRFPQPSSELGRRPFRFVHTLLTYRQLAPKCENARPRPAFSVCHLPASKPRYRSAERARCWHRRCFGQGRHCRFASAGRPAPSWPPCPWPRYLRRRV